MSDAPRTTSITLAFAGAVSDPEALEVVARLAAALNAELHGLFIEDSNLLRLANLPFARGYSHHGPPMALQSEEMARLLQREAIAVRHALMRSAERAGARWRFTTAHGSLVREIQMIAAESQAIAIGLSRRAQALLGGAPFAPSPRGRPSRPITAVFSGSPASQRALALAVRLAGSLRRPITVLLPQDREAAASLKKEALALVPDAYGLRTLPPGASLSVLAEAIRREQPALAVLEANEETMSDLAIAMLNNDISCPALLVR